MLVAGVIGGRVCPGVALLAGPLGAPGRPSGCPWPTQWVHLAGPMGAPGRPSGCSGAVHLAGGDVMTGMRGRGDNRQHSSFSLHKDTYIIHIARTHTHKLGCVMYIHIRVCIHNTYNVVHIQGIYVRDRKKTSVKLSPCNTQIVTT